MRDFYLPRYKLQQTIKMSAVVSEDDIKNEYIKKNIDYTITAIHIPKNAIQDRVIKPTDEELEKEYKKNKDDFEEPEKRHLSIVSWQKNRPLKIQ